MKKFNYRELEFHIDKAESMKDLRDSLSSVANDLDEIKKVFKVQLDKAGDPKREELVEEIIRYCYTNRDMKVLIETIDPNYAFNEEAMVLMLYDVANIVDAINNKDVEKIDEAVSALPYDESNSGYVIAGQTLEFAYGMLSDIDKAVNRELFQDIAKTYGYATTDYEFDRDFTNFGYLGNLKRANDKTLKLQD